jgi:tetratricopeptide (TPR) repeat protein
MEKSAVWHRRLALTLRLAGYVNEAIEELQTSLKLDDSESFTYFGLACCSEIRKEFSEAINWMQQGLDRLEEGNDSLRSAQLIALSKWNLELLEADVAIKCAEEARILDPQNVLPAYAQLKALGALELPLRATRIFEYLKLLRTLPTEHAGLSMLTRLFAYGFQTQTIVLGVANTAEHCELLFEAYNTAEAECEAVDEHLKAALQRYMRGELLNDQMEKPDEAMIIYEDLLEREVDTQHESSSTEDKWNFIKNACSYDLSIIYFNSAVAARKSGKDATPFIAKLENLAKRSYGQIDVFGTGSASAALGSLYRMDGRHEEADHTLRERVLKSIAILEDADPDNDLLGYFGLAQSLLIAGRRDDAVAAAAPALISLERAKARYERKRARIAGVASLPPIPDNVTKAATAESPSLSIDQPKSQEQDKDEVETDEIMSRLMDMWETDSTSCSGCKRFTIEYEETHCCESCMDTSFCEICYPKMKSGELELNICSSTHSFVRLYPIPEEAKGVATQVVNGKLLPRKEWLDKLRSDWAA